MDTPNLRRRAISLVIILTLYFIFDPAPTPAASSREIERAITSENAAWSLLNSSRYGDFDPAAGRWLNLTGFQRDGNRTWVSLAQAQERAREFVVSAVGAENSDAVISGDVSSVKGLQFYHNVTGEIRGSWKRTEALPTTGSDAQNADVPVDTAKQPAYRNFTGSTGTLQLGLKEAGAADEWKGLNVRGIRGRMIVFDEDTAESFFTILTGLHMIETGSIILVSHSTYFPALFGLPHLALSEHQFLATQHRLNRTLKDVIELQSTNQLKNAAPWTPAQDMVERQSCDMLVYLQQYPLSNGVDGLAIEKELRWPRGRLRLEAEDIHMNMVLFSPNCDYVVESAPNGNAPSLSSPAHKDLTGPKLEVYNGRVKVHILAFALILMLQAHSIIQQRRDASTPSMKNRISVVTMIILTLADGNVAISFLPMIALTDNLFTTMAAAAAMAVLCLYFSLPFLGSIWTVQHEDALREARQQRTPSTQAASPIPILSAAGADSLPLPVTARPAINIIGADGEMVPAGEDTRDPRSVMQSRLAFGIVTLWILSIWMTTMSSAVQRGYFLLLSTVYVSCWVPQIVRNAMRNCRKALRWDFVVGQSIWRLIPLLYFYVYNNNLADSATQPLAALFLIGCSWTQLCILVVQYIFGPRLLIPTSWLPPAYDYHQVLKEDDESTQIILGHATSPTSTTFKHLQAHSSPTTEHQQRIERSFDCAICMQSIRVPIIQAGQDGLAQNSFLWRRTYMITPCRHVFHTKCLAMAMRYRLQCPICREGLPPL